MVIDLNQPPEEDQDPAMDEERHGDQEHQDPAMDDDEQHHDAAMNEDLNIFYHSDRV